MVRNERREQVPETPSMSFQNIVTWDKRTSYPMLGHIDPIGVTVFNRLQVRSLIAELDRVRAGIDRGGVSATALALGAESVEESLQIQSWNAERDLAGLVEDLVELCNVSLQRVHRYLWFQGD